jgi:DNA polymerase II large subunit
MKTPIVDHSWTKIVETDARGLAFAEQKLREVGELARKIRASEGQDVANNVLHSGLIETALLRCKQFHEGHAGLTVDDLHINYRYATQAMKESEQIIDAELDYLGL